jgi:polyisoprenoid-binding protein YceI
MYKLLQFFSVTFLFVMSSLSSSSYPADDKPIQLNFVSSSGEVQFRAIGHPSALHVVGKGLGPEGTATIKSSVANAELNFDVTSLATGIEVRDRHMKEKYLETEKFPKATLKITVFTLPEDFSKGPFNFTAAPFSGTLTLHGVTAPVSGTADVQWDGKEAITMTALFSIKLTQFAITIPSFSGITIADEVQLTVTSKPQIAKKTKTE